MHDRSSYHDYAQEHYNNIIRPNLLPSLPEIPQENRTANTRTVCFFIAVKAR